MTDRSPATGAAHLVARGTTRLLAGLLSAKGLDFAFYLLLARQLGVEQFGRYTFALSFTLLFAILADLGVLTVFTREASRGTGAVRALLRPVVGIKIVLGLVTVAAATGIALATGAPAETVLLVLVFASAMLVNSFAFLFDNLLKSVGRAGAAGVSILAQSATALATGAALLFAGHGVLGGALAYLAAALVHLATAAVWSRALWRAPSTPTAGGPSAAGAAGGWRWFLRESAPLALSGAFIAIYFRADSVLLHALVGESAVGFYGGAYRFFEAFVLLSAAYRSVLFPVMARAADGPGECLGVLCRRSLRLHLMFTVGVAVFFTLQARQVVTLLLGSAYAPAAPALAILMWALPGAFMADTLLHLLAAQRRQSAGTRALALTAGFNVALNLAVIPRFSFVGAAATTVASELMSFALMYLAFRSTVPRIGLFGVARAPLAAGAIAAGALLFLSPLDPGGPAGLALMAMFAMSAYILALVALGALGRQDAELVRALIPSGLRIGHGGDRRHPGLQA